MTHHVLCDEFADRLADLLERDVDEVTRAALESHALSCDKCGSLLADLRKLRIDASNLPVLTPSTDLWQGISDRIGAPVIPLHGGAGTSTTGTWWRRIGPMIAAAVVLVAVSSVSTHYLTVRGRGAARPTTGAARPGHDSAVRVASADSQTVPLSSPADSSTAASQSAPRGIRPEPAAAAGVRFANAKPSAEHVYATEIARLHEIVKERRAQLDPVTVSVIERNLKVIDDAIAQCRVALAKDPASRFLMESLNDALETKVKLLRTVAMLPARS